MATHDYPYATWLWQFLSWPARVAEARRDFALLATLDDRGLADIGLSRQDLRDATALPLSENPTGRLAEVAKERAVLATAARRKAGLGSVRGDAALLSERAQRRQEASLRRPWQPSYANSRP
jgi:uncharacterized protein YjiS (DUF1127 family)